MTYTGTIAYISFSLYLRNLLYSTASASYSNSWRFQALGSIMPVAIKAPTVLSLQADKVFTWFIGTQLPAAPEVYCSWTCELQPCRASPLRGECSSSAMVNLYRPVLKEVNQRPNRTASITHFRIDLRRGARPHSMGIQRCYGLCMPDLQH